MPLESFDINQLLSNAFLAPDDIVNLECIDPLILGQNGVKI